MSVERWLPVVGYEGSYEVSDLGRVRSLTRVTHDGKHLTGRTLTPFEMPSGHLRISLGRLGTKKTHKVHRLVLIAFIGPAPASMEALHADGRPANNALANLSWGTKSQNSRDAIAHGTHPIASRTHCPSGHEYTPENTYLWPRSNHRGCLQCIRSRYAKDPEKYRARTRAYRARKKAGVNA